MTSRVSAGEPGSGLLGMFGSEIGEGISWEGDGPDIYNGVLS